MRTVTRPKKGSGDVVCCGGHRSRCLYGRPHCWTTWYENGRLQRTAETYYCSYCAGVCTSEEES